MGKFDFDGKVDFDKLKERGKKFPISNRMKYVLVGVAVVVGLGFLVFVPDIGAVTVTGVESPDTGEIMDVQDETFETPIGSMFLAEFGYCNSSDGLEMECQAEWGELSPI